MAYRHVQADVENFFQNIYKEQRVRLEKRTIDWHFDGKTKQVVQKGFMSFNIQPCQGF